MRTVGILNEIKMQCESIKFDIRLYVSSSLLLTLSIVFSFVNFIYNPVFVNSLVLEVSIIGAVFCIYSIISYKNKLNMLKEKELEIKIRNKVSVRKRSYI